MPNLLCRFNRQYHPIISDTQIIKKLQEFGMTEIKIPKENILRCKAYIGYGKPFNDFLIASDLGVVEVFEDKRSISMKLRDWLTGNAHNFYGRGYSIFLYY